MDFVHKASCPTLIRMEDHAVTRNTRSFTQQARTFADPRFNRILTTESEWLYTALPLSPDDLLLEVAAGTAIASRSLAPKVQAVVALDATPEMLATGQTQALEAGLTNLVFQRGDANALPFLDASFDVVVCRYALHHFPAPERPLGEMARVLKPGAYLAIADLTADEDPDAAVLQNELETLRDPSHARVLSVNELTDAIADLGLTVISSEARSVRRPLHPWLEQTETPSGKRQEIIAALEGDLGGGRRTGLDPAPQDGSLTFVQSFVSIVAQRPL